MACGTSLLQHSILSNRPLPQDWCGTFEGDTVSYMRGGNLSVACGTSLLQYSILNYRPLPPSHALKIQYIYMYVLFYSIL